MKVMTKLFTLGDDQDVLGKSFTIFFSSDEEVFRKAFARETVILYFLEMVQTSENVVDVRNVSLSNLRFIEFCDKGRDGRYHVKYKC